MTYSCKS